MEAMAIYQNETFKPDLLLCVSWWAIKKCIPWKGRYHQVREIHRRAKTGRKARFLCSTSWRRTWAWRTLAHLLLKSKGEKNDAPHLQHCYLKLSFY
jgi:hypothetical protein